MPEFKEDDIKPAGIEPFSTNLPDASAIIDKNLQEFYSLNPQGRSMSTFKELSEIAEFSRTMAEIYADAAADGKFDLQDLGRNLVRIPEIIEEGKAAFTFEGPVVFSELTKEQTSELLSHFMRTVFVIAKVEPTGENPASYKELKEIFDAFTEATELFESVCADGKINLMDLPGNLTGIIDLGKAIQAAAKVDGEIDIKSLTEEQITELVAIFLGNVYTIVESVKKLQS